jgi:flagellar basal-body rod protein FlgC
MNGILSIAASGLQAQSTRLHSSSHNVANLITDDFRPQRVDLQARAGGGVQATVSSSEERGSLRYDLETGELLGEYSGTDLAHEALTQISASRSYEANLAVIRSEKDRLATLLDILA